MANKESKIEVPNEVLADIPADKRDAARKKIEKLVGGYGDKLRETSATPSSPEKKSAGAEKTVSFAEDKDTAQQQLEQVIESFEEKHGQVDLAHHTEPLVGPAVRSGIAIGSVPFFVSYLASMRSMSPFLTSAGFGAVGAWLGKKFAPNHPKMGPALGGMAGVVSPPMVKMLGGGLESYISALHTAAPTALKYGAAGGLGTGAGILTYLFTSKILGIKNKKFNTIAALSSGGGAALLGYAGGANALTAPVTLLSSIETASTAALASSLSLFLTTASAAAGVYGLGRLEGWLWNRSMTTGIFKNLLRGAMAPATIPAWLLWKPTSALYRGGKRAVARNVDAVKRMFTGKSLPVKAVTAPVWWPMRTAYRFGRGMVRGAINGITKSPPSDLDNKQGIEAKLGRALPYAAGRILRSPVDAAKWLLSPSW
ncbi:MAG: hypothetical protein PHN33_06035 [Candidatus Peribacteraceae bacterium]|nr:hypothetical protein [Candidatus Peribacteraceae bacterium]